MVVPVLDVLMVAGFQVPVIPLFDVVGKAGAAMFWHSGPICVKDGVTCVVITMSILVEAPHCPPDGVNV